jgi:hypothetical protein
MGSIPFFANCFFFSTNEDILNVSAPTRRFLAFLEQLSRVVFKVF